MKNGGVYAFYAPLVEGFRFNPYKELFGHFQITTQTVNVQYSIKLTALEFIEGPPIPDIGPFDILYDKYQNILFGNGENHEDFVAHVSIIPGQYETTITDILTIEIIVPFPEN